MLFHPEVPDYVPDALVEAYGTPIDEHSTSARRDPRPGAATSAPVPGTFRQVIVLVAAVELALLGLVAMAMWWTALAFTDSWQAWVGLAYGGWVLVFHLPVLLAGLLLRGATTDRTQPGRRTNR